MGRVNKGLIAGGATAAIGAIGALLGLTPLGASFEENVGLGWLFSLRGPIAPPPEVVVIAIDDRTGENLGISKLPREWPRSVHGRLIENLVRRGVSTIVFDFDFQIAKNPDDDLAFGRSIAEADRVVLAAKLNGKRQPIFDREGRQKGSVWMEQVLPPIPSLAEAAKGLGPFPLPKVEVAVHEFWAFKPSVGDAPTMPAVALQIHALEAYPRFAQLFTGIWGSGTPPLPPWLEGVVRADQVSNLMRAMRTNFNRAPERIPQFRELLDQQPEETLPSSERRLLSALIGLYEGGDHRYLNFYGPPGTITTIPYHLIASQGKTQPETQIPNLKGKVAFVGFSDLYDPGQPDRFYTVFTNDEGVDLSGVEIAATAFGNLIEDRTLRTGGPLSTTAILLAFGATMAVLVLLMPAIAAVPLMLTLGVIYIIAAHKLFANSAVWLPLAIPLLVQFPLALFGGLSFQYLSERRKKKQATRAISYYLPENVAKDFMEKAMDPSVLNRVTLGICFASDMAGFTSISEQLPPAELAVFLNDYFDTLSKPLRRHGVDVVEFRADGIMCAWTAEELKPSVRSKAVLAALEAVDAISHFKERHALLTQSLRIGLEAGNFYVGHAGGGGHFVYSIVGDCANTAARIEGLNKHLGTQLLASRATVDGLDELLTRFLGEFRFVGKSDALPIFEIVAIKSNASEDRFQLCERFQDAMSLLATGEWQQAGDLFQIILNDYPNDGPSRFHLARCRRYAQESSPPESPCTVLMDSK